MNKKGIRILWLYHDLLDLYGDSGNLLTLRRRLEQMGIEATLIQKSLEEEMAFTSCDMIVVGAGKTRNLIAAIYRRWKGAAPCWPAAAASFCLARGWRPKAKR